MSECEACIYELMGHSNGKIIKLMCREGSRCPFYKPKAKEERKSDE